MLLQRGINQRRVQENPGTIALPRQLLGADLLDLRQPPHRRVRDQHHPSLHTLPPLQTLLRHGLPPRHLLPTPSVSIRSSMVRFRMETTQHPALVQPRLGRGVHPFIEADGISFPARRRMPIHPPRPRP
ncbi:hypothetical protein RSOL_433280 [Rhizoctonia solani AG-3 Rhs1AP]|uniref:Uncharacterized protein n=1 Tax=Rhizoctonia solani AG-3 Rhs1AP TaxID=1086054 RepID=X8JL86_9AGAM|nr:hypothetical protein RSOL_433280 [Rhizoctonia solani AG-3 Rhs1AP]